jgi:hypothetical protein
MNWLRRAIREWLSADRVLLKAPIEANGFERSDGQPTYRVSVIKAVNGTVLELGVFKRNPHGPDWTHELYIVGENERISAAIERILAIKKLES